MTRLIDADALKDWSEIVPLTEDGGIDINDFDEKLMSMPTVDAEPVRHGRFIGTEYDGYADGNPVYYEWKCSECGCVFEDEEPTYNYCPNCGADMKGENNE